MNIGDKVIILSKDIDGEKNVHNFRVGQVCTVVEIEEDMLRLEGTYKSKTLRQYVYESQVMLYEQTNKSN